LGRLVVRCPECKQKFPWQSNLGEPEWCPHCGYQTAKGQPDDEIVMPSLRSARMAATDGVYRQMEQASEARMYQAAEMAGCSPSDMAGLKITNLRDTKEGEIAAPSVTAETQRLTTGQNGPGFRQMGAEAAVGVSSGSTVVNGRVVPDAIPGTARAGMQALSNVQRLHSR
jgi:hypothetical protein